MEFDRDLYQKAFSRIALSDKKREEILHMSEQNEKRRKPIGRRMLVAAVTALLAAILAMGANAATDGELGESFVKLVDSVTTQNGMKIQLYEGKTADHQNTKLIIIDNKTAKSASTYATVTVHAEATATEGTRIQLQDAGSGEDGTYQLHYSTSTRVAPIVEVKNNGSESVITVVDGDGGTCSYSVDEETDSVEVSYNQAYYYTYEDIPTMFVSEPEE